MPQPNLAECKDFSTWRNWLA